MKDVFVMFNGEVSKVQFSTTVPVMFAPSEGVGLLKVFADNTVYIKIRKTVDPRAKMAALFFLNAPLLFSKFAFPHINSLS